MRLRRKGMAKRAVAHAVGRLESERLLDDAEFAREYARAKTARGYGRSRILADLSSKGVNRRDAELAVAACGGDDEDQRRERLVALARKRAGRLIGLDRDVARRRLLGYLTRRGYEPAETWETVTRVLGAAPDDREPPA